MMDYPMNPETNDAEATSVKDYLRRLMLLLWTQGEGFNSKRPFGNSGWEIEIAHALVKGGAIPGKIVTYTEMYAGESHTYEELEDYDREALDNYVAYMINNVFSPPEFG